MISGQPGASAVSAGKRSRFRQAVVVVAILCVGLIVSFLLWQRTVPSSRLLQEGRRAFAQRKFRAAERAAARVLSRDPRSAAALLLAGQSARKLGRDAAAVGYFERIPDDGSVEAVSARCEAGDLLLLEMKHLSEAEEQFRRAIRQQPDSETANDRLAYLLGLSSRSWEATEFRLALIRLGQFFPVHLYLLCLGETALENEEIVQEYHAADPADPLPQLGLARIAMVNQKPARAEQLLRTAIRTRPDLIEAHVKLGQLLLETGSAEEFRTWHARLPERAEEHPGIWTLRGDWAQKQAEIDVAARCYWEAVRRDPNLQPANYQLSQVLVSLGESEQSAPFLEKASLLGRYVNTVKVADAGTDTTEMQKAARMAESLGLLWEAYGWYRLTLFRNPRLDGARRELTRLMSTLSRLGPVRTDPEKNPALRVDLSAYPLPDWPAGVPGKMPKTRPPSDDDDGSRVVFADLASSAGLNFSYYNGSDLESPGRRMYEFTGGGAAVLDYDCNGWPDIYLTQGCSWPPQTEQGQHLDRLFCNLGNGRFVDVTAQARLAENRFSHGVTVGDYNNDGFPDLYVANIGKNRLCVNNGDGTFSDVTDATSTGDKRWTTSCLVADLNGDALPDVYAVNYLTGDDVFDRVCEHSDGKPQICLPHYFPADQDQLYLNLGDGRFENVTAASGVVAADGKGLGIVAADFDGSGRLSLFVGNDAEPNFYFVNQTSRPGGPPLFAEQALPTGLALNYDGRPEACMGIAAGDSDGDGLIDLFVGNYYLESNTLYRQQPGGLFIDASRDAALHAPSLQLLTFGTQFLDGGLNGRLDLILTNGYVEDDRHHGIPYRMPPQYFRNVGDGRFAELAPESLGRYFEGKYLGRGMARLDWNRDGLEDVVVSHLDAPAALVTNQTAHAGHFLAVKLVGVASSRDAIGTTVELQVDDRTFVRQLSAGDGYMASNQRLLTFGLGEERHIDVLVIRWPSGLEQQFNDLSADRELLFIEGHSHLYHFSGH